MGPTEQAGQRRPRQLGPPGARAGRDAIIIGGGHNGLVAACYLARAGMRPLLLERRAVLGGACVTEEFAPGYRASPGAYVLSMLRPAVWRDLQLTRRGVRVDAAGPTLNLYREGGHLYLPDEVSDAAAAIGHFSGRDAAALLRFETDLARMAPLLVGTFDRTPPDPRLQRPRDLGELLRLGSSAVRHRGALADALFLLSTSVRQFLGERFERAEVQAALGWHAINDSLQGPATPGTAFVLLHDHASGEAGGGIRRWGFVRGGMGQLTAAMATAAGDAGAELRTGAEVSGITTRAGRVTGVVLAGGDEIRADVVLSGADPKRTFLGLCPPAALPPEFVAAIRAYRCEGTSMKINLAVAELPQVRGLGRGLQPYHRGVLEVSPTLEELELHQAEARRGVPAERTHIELCFPTVHDPDLAPPGRHIVTIDVNSQPFRLHDESWDDRREAVADRVVAELGELMPNLPGAVLARQVLSPLDLERVLGLTGGHALHGEMTPDQLYFLRPARGFADYRTPIGGLYLCGAGTHPGGGVTGANGRNCAREVLRDRSRRRPQVGD